MQVNKRIVFVDIARTFAIILALFDHSMNDFNIWANYEFSKYAAFKAFTSTATPTFLFLFGMMVEIVYLKKVKRGQLDYLINQNLHRSLKCYTGYIFTALAGFIGGILAFKTVIGAAVFISNTHFGNILRLYTFLILLSIPILLLRQKKGFIPLLYLNLSIWVLVSFLKFIPVNNGNIANFTSFFFGFGNANGPSLLLSISIMSLGMYSASYLRQGRKYNFLKNNLKMIAVLVSILMVSVLFIPASEITKNFLTNIYRFDNHPIYYIIGMTTALILVSIFSLIFPLGSNIPGFVSPILVFSRKSLESFTIGNIILNIFHPFIVQNDWNISAPLLFIVICLLFMILYEKAELNPYPLNFIYGIRKWYYNTIHDGLLKKASVYLLNFTSK